MTTVAVGAALLVAAVVIPALALLLGFAVGAWVVGDPVFGPVESMPSEGGGQR